MDNPCPIHRDDPDLDENTRLRNRIAELESLVRELRGMCFHIFCGISPFRSNSETRIHASMILPMNLLLRVTHVKRPLFRLCEFQISLFLSSEQDSPDTSHIFPLPSRQTTSSMGGSKLL
jgi:hypothetical protein